MPFLRKARDLPRAAGFRSSEVSFSLAMSDGGQLLHSARAAGLRVLGRTPTPELGIGSSESALCGVTRNPWDLDRTTGGSTAGSAALSLRGSSRSPAVATPVGRSVYPHPSVALFT